MLQADGRFGVDARAFRESGAGGTATIRRAPETLAVDGTLRVHRTGSRLIGHLDSGLGAFGLGSALQVDIAIPPAGADGDSPVIVAVGC